MEDKEYTMKKCTYNERFMLLLLEGVNMGRSLRRIFEDFANKN
jgi:hypothetical protein